MTPTAVSADERAFFEAIRAAKADDLPRLVFTDWLEEHGRLVHAAYIRTQLSGQVASVTAAQISEWFSLSLMDIPSCSPVRRTDGNDDPADGTMVLTTETVPRGEGIFPASVKRGFDIHRGFIRFVWGVRPSQFLPRAREFVAVNPGLERVRMAWEDVHVFREATGARGTVYLGLVQEEAWVSVPWPSWDDLPSPTDLLSHAFPGVTFDIEPEPAVTPGHYGERWGTPAFAPLWVDYLAARSGDRYRNEAELMRRAIIDSGLISLADQQMPLSREFLISIGVNPDLASE